MASWPASIIHPPTSVGAVFFILFLSSEFGGPGRGQFCLLRVRKNREVPDFARFLIHLSVSLLASTCSFAGRHPYPVGQGSAAVRSSNSRTTIRPPSEVTRDPWRWTFSEVLNDSCNGLVTRYAQRVLIENNISEAIQFFHMDALSSMVGLKVDFDLQLTLMALPRTD